MGKLIRKEKREYVTLKHNSMMLPRRDVYTVIRNGLQISIPDTSENVEEKITKYLTENLAKFGYSKFVIQEVQLRERKKNLTTFFGIFTTDEIAEKLLKSHTRTFSGKRINVQPAIVPPVKKVGQLFFAPVPFQDGPCKQSFFLFKKSKQSIVLKNIMFIIAIFWSVKLLYLICRKVTSCFPTG